MSVRVSLASLAGDLARWGLVSVLHRNGGALPGAIALKLAPNIVAELGQALDASVVVTGTNGKTTTTGLVADGLAADGRTVVCNRAGNNMETGIAAALMATRHDVAGKHALGAFECDELYTVRVLPKLRPRALVLLNLFRDQLDRYGEIDHTQDAIARALASSPETALIYNADDPLCASIAARVDNPGLPFGIDEPTNLEADRISDSRFCAKCNAPLDYEYVHYGQLGKYACPVCGWKRPELAFAVTHVELECSGYAFDVEDRRGPTVATYHLTCRYNGLYMVYNIAAAFAATLVAGGDVARFQGVLDSYVPAGDRGRTFTLAGGALEVVSNLAKNPTGFDRMIQQIKTEKGQHLAFFLNDNDADGHDVSWIWDVDFERLLDAGVPLSAFVGGSRAGDLLVRLKYAGIAAQVIEGIEEAVDATAAAVAAGGWDNPKLYAVANYTAFPPVVADLERLERSWERTASANDATPMPVPVCKGAIECALDRPLRIVHLYPDALNLYGDGGNIASMTRRCEWRGIPAQVDSVLMGQELDLEGADIVLLGGGADRDQLAVAHELQGQREKLAAYVADGGVLLAICGGYQLLGEYYMMGDTRVDGLGILDIQTTAGSDRLIGNVAVTSDICAEPIVGFENHAGRTVLGADERPLGKSLRAHSGNNGTDGCEGVLHHNVVGTYLHGPILPKNPGVTDWLIAQALRRRGVDVALSPLDDEAERLAHAQALEIARRE